MHPLPGGAPEITDDIPAMIGARQTGERFFLNLALSCSPMLCGADRVRTLKATLAKIQPEPAHAPLPPLKVYAPP